MPYGALCVFSAANLPSWQTSEVATPGVLPQLSSFCRNSVTTPGKRANRTSGYEEREIPLGDLAGLALLVVNCLAEAPPTDCLAQLLRVRDSGSRR
jgi:hypothetical protein